MQFEQLTYKRLIEFYGEGSQTVDATKMVHMLRYIEHTILPAHAGAQMKFTLFSDELIEPGDHTISSHASSVTKALAAAVVDSSVEVKVGRTDGMVERVQTQSSDPASAVGAKMAAAEVQAAAAALEQVEAEAATTVAEAK